LGVGNHEKMDFKTGTLCTAWILCTFWIALFAGKYAGFWEVSIGTLPDWQYQEKTEIYSNLDASGLLGLI
jgi:hypothetical protein